MNGLVKKRTPKKTERASEEKWGAEVMAYGFCIVPSILLRAQARLRLNATQLAILMHLADFWWEAARKPHPSKRTLGDRLHLSPRQIQRHIARMENMKLVRRIERRPAARGTRSSTNYYDLSGLVQRLKELEPEFREAQEKAREARSRRARLVKERRAVPATDET